MLTNLKSNKSWTLTVIFFMLLTSPSLFLKTKSLAEESWFSKDIVMNNSSTWEKITNLFIRVKERVATLGDGVCLISPNTATRTTLSRTPQFLWQGNVTEIRILSGSDKKKLWSYKIEDNESTIIYNKDDGTTVNFGTVIYDGEGESALNFGEEYYFYYKYDITDSTGKTVSYDNDDNPIILTVEDEQSNQQIQEELKDQGLEINDNLTKEEKENILEKRAVFFAEKKLFLDMIKELELLRNTTSSEDLKMKIYSYYEQFCE